METFLELYKGFKPYIPAGIIAYIYQVFIAFAVRLQVCALSMMSFDVNHSWIFPERRIQQWGELNEKRGYLVVTKTNSILYPLPAQNGWCSVTNNPMAVYKKVVTKALRPRVRVVTRLTVSERPKQKRAHCKSDWPPHPCSLGREWENKKNT